MFRLRTARRRDLSCWALAARVHVLAPASLRDQVMEEMRAAIRRPPVSL